METGASGWLLIGTREYVLTLGSILVNVRRDRFAIHRILRSRAIKNQRLAFSHLVLGLLTLPTPS